MKLSFLIGFSLLALGLTPLIGCEGPAGREAGAPLVTLDAQGNPVATSATVAGEPALPLKAFKVDPNPTPAVTPDARPIILEKWGPMKIKVGQTFHLQPNGDSVMLFQLNRINADMWVYLDNRQLTKPARNLKGKSMSVVIPRDCIGVAGTHSLHITDHFSGVKSDPVDFVVE